MYYEINLFSFKTFFLSPEDMLIDFKDRGREEERGGERETTEINTDWLPVICAQTTDQSYNLGMCPDWALNL